jgi:hypothetical protein
VIARPVVHEVYIPEGNAGILLTAARMRALILAPSRRGAAALGQALEGQLHLGQVAKAGLIYRWVQAHMVYTADGEMPDSVPREEELRAPDYLLAAIDNAGRAQGDCDDWVILMGHLFHLAGLPATMVLVSGRADGEFDHVYLRVGTEHGWIGADAIHGAPFGWELDPALVTNRAEVLVA